MAHLNERSELPTICADCGLDTGLDDSRAFEVTDDEVLCWACALRRGGVFDAEQERWTVPPDLADLPDERRPHA